MEEGDTYETNNYGKVEVLNYLHSRKVQITFKNTGHVDYVRPDHLRNGAIADKSLFKKPKDYLIPRVHGVGWLGSYTSAKGNRKVYYIWRNMLKRCYSPKFLKENPSYRGCTVDPTWHDFRNFLKWHKEQIYIKGYQLDKDLYVEGNKVYGPDACFYVPAWLNSSQMYKDSLKRKQCHGKYVSSLRKNGVQKYLGRFKTSEEADQCYIFHKYLHLHTKLIITNDFIPVVLLNALLEKCYERVKNTGYANKKLLVVMNVNMSNLETKV